MNKMEALTIQHQAFEGLGSYEFAVVKNPEYVFSPVEVYPLALKNTWPLPIMPACVMDMDGTTTTTEPLCIHSQEYMIRKVTGMMSREDWAGFDEAEDYPNIIGNSTTKHIEYLMGKYGNRVSPEKLMASFIESVIWTYALGQRFGRWNEVRQTVAAAGLNEILKDLECIVEESLDDSAGFAERLYRRYKDNCGLPEFNLVVRMAMDIYYARYHLILLRLLKNEKVGDEYLVNPPKSLIEPMPGIPFFLALLKGWLDKYDIEALFEPVLVSLAARYDFILPEKLKLKQKRKLQILADYFKVNPVKLALVTSSIGTEAEIVLAEVMKEIQKEIESWPLGHHKKNRLAARFKSCNDVYDAVITADDSSEIRLKPHRDLYSIALYQLGVKKEDYQYVMGCEDSESGIIAMRAAGISCCIALPFKNTENHKFWAASHVLSGALPELILIHCCNMDLKVGDVPQQA